MRGTTELVCGSAAILVAFGLGVLDAGACTGDLDNNGIVDGADLGQLLSTWGQVGTGDLDGNGIVDGADLGALLANWGPCPPPLEQGHLYEGKWQDLAGQATTSVGVQPAPFSADIAFILDDPQATSDVRLVHPVQLTMLCPGVNTLEGPTGGIDFRLEPQALPGTWNPETGDLFIPLQFQRHDWQIDQFVPPMPTGLEDGFTATELWGGQFVGHAFDTGDGLSVTGQLQLSVELPITGQLVEVQVDVEAEDVPRKDFGTIPDCPEAQRCNKRKVCVQPVFIGTGANDATKTGTSYEVFKAKADTIWAKACVEIEWQDPVYVNKPGYKTIEKVEAADGVTELRSLKGEVDEKGENECIEVFFVSKFVKTNGDNHGRGDGTTFGGGTASAKVIVSDAAIADCDPDADGVLAHELGHAMGDCEHTDDTVMKPTGNPPNCPGQNPSKVSSDEIAAVQKGALVKLKDPKEECCSSPD
ncbi:MAG: hypothetical protein KDA22_07510 [Phycisphaerales bacterium]|nr:hypothetical protein [Phycisphaerales bacterium]